MTLLTLIWVQMMNDASESDKQMALEPLNARALLRRFDIRPLKRLGQNFLIDPIALDRVIAAADLSGRETVLEVGAGLGALTLRLAPLAQSVIAVEYDHRLLPILEYLVGGYDNVDLVAGDVLRLDLDGLLGENPYCVVSNIPYNITSALIRRLLITPRKADRLVLTVQKEVAERIVSEPGEMNLLAIGVQMYGTPKIYGRISAESFYPRPNVESAILRVTVHSQPLFRQALIEPIFRLARAGFSQKRKQLRNALSGGLGLKSGVIEVWLREAGIEPSRRAQELDLESWATLAEAMLKSGEGKAG
jgi:16S rRNA (adenine1518-N6/adenine1519-N6)-dimethyltransferase